MREERDEAKPAQQRGIGRVFETVAGAMRNERISDWSNSSYKFVGSDLALLWFSGKTLGRISGDSPIYIKSLYQ
jgi:hypothetical protein